MDNTKLAEKSSWQALRWCSLMTVFYVLLVFILPNNKTTLHTYKLSNFEYHIVLLVVALPVIAIWFFAFWGYAKLKTYSLAINKTKEGPGFSKLATGLGWLAWSLPITSILNRILGSINNDAEPWHSGSVILVNYIEMLLLFVAFLLIASAAKTIVKNTRLNLNLHSARFIMIIFVFVGILYCYLTLRAFNLSSLSSTENPYHLPAWLMIVSVIVPYLYAWFIGLLAAYEINIYAKDLKGVLYRRPLLLITGGLAAVILSFIASQYVSTAWPTGGNVVFNFKLIIGLVFRIIGGLGFISMAIGANRLKRIEDV